MTMTFASISGPPDCKGSPESHFQLERVKTTNGFISQQYYANTVMDYAHPN